MFQVISLQKSRLNELKYVIIPGKPDKSFAAGQLHDQAYLYWKRFWSKIYADAGSPESFACEDFLRQDFIPVLLYRDQIVGMHLYTLFRLDQQAVHDHRYFKMYPDHFFPRMADRNLRYAMSIEYLTVDPAWRKSEVGVSLGTALIGASIGFFDHLPIDALIAPARTDNRVHEMCYEFGFECFQAGLQKRNFTVDLVVAPRGTTTPSKNEEMNELIRQLWNRREDLTGRTASQILPDRAAA